MPQTQFNSMNIELTNKCPLKCPQCYCSLTGDKHINVEIAKAKIKEASVCPQRSHVLIRPVFHPGNSPIQIRKAAKKITSAFF